MSRYNHKHNWVTKDYLYRILGVIGITALLVMMMPRERAVNYNFKIGEPWDEETLIAKDSFPILKTSERLKAEIDSINKYVEPYFRRDRHIGEKQIQDFKNAAEKDLNAQISLQLEQHISERLAEIYERGILSLEDHRRLTERGSYNIRIYEEQNSTTKAFKEVFSIRSAYEYLINDPDSIHYPKAILSRFELNRFITPNCIYDEKKSEQELEEISSMIVPYTGQVLVGQKIIGKGEIITEETFQVLNSLVQHEKEKELTVAERIRMTGGQVLFVLICVIALLIYFTEFRSDYLVSWKFVCLVVMLYTIFPLTTSSLVQRTDITPYVIPYAIVPIFIRIFMDSRTAFIVHAIVVVTTSIIIKDKAPFIIVQCIAGLTAIYSLRDLTERRELFRTVVFVLISSGLVSISMHLIDGSLKDLSGIINKEHIGMAISAGLLMISYLLLVPVERLLGLTSSITLLELSNTNHPILRSLAEEAPGTFQHSMQVANLAAAVAEGIGAKSQLVRTGALYHDIGKIRHAVFFTENQKGINPHDRLSPEQSARIIISHVRDGEKLADKYNLPKDIRDFITVHHGTSIARFFYTQAQNSSPDEIIDPTMFTYPGPNPSTAEQAILMMCDAVEAASRSLKEVTEDNIKKLTENIVGTQFKSGYFDKCPLTFKDINTAKDILVKKLSTIYHTRIQYPELKVHNGSTSA